MFTESKFLGLTMPLFSRSGHSTYFSIFPCFPSPNPTIENVSAISSLFLALTLFPRVQKRAQAELDDVIGRDRLPTFDDKARLPYIEALCKELLRWKMVTPLGMT